MEKFKKSKLTTKLLASVIALCATAATGSKLYAMESTSQSAITTETNKIKETSVEEEEAKQYARESAKKLLQKLKSNNVNLKNVNLILLARGGNCDGHDNIQCYYKGRKVNIGLDYLVYAIAEYLQSLNTNSDDRIFLPIIVDPADYYVTELDDVRDKFDTILPAMPIKKVQQKHNFGAKYYGTLRAQIPAIKEFLKIVAPELGYEVKENKNGSIKFINPEDKKTFPLLYFMINNSDDKSEGFELYYSPGAENEKLARIISKNCKNVISKLEKDRENCCVENSGKQVTKFAKESNLNGQLNFIDFGDIERVQKIILDPNSMRVLAGKYVLSLAEWLNVNPVYTCITIKPSEQNNYSFTITAHLKNVDPNKLPAGSIIVGRADIDKKYWNEEKNKALIKVEPSKENEGYELSREFDPFTDGYKFSEQFIELANKDGKGGYSNRFYIKVIDKDNNPLISDIANFTIKTDSDNCVEYNPENFKDFNSAAIEPNNFTKFDVIKW